MTEAHATLPERIIHVLKHLGLGRAHSPASMPRDWKDLAIAHADGKVGAVVRSADLSRWVNLPLSVELKNTVDAAGLFGATSTTVAALTSVSTGGLPARDWKTSMMIPQWANPKDGERLQSVHESLLSGAELTEWRSTVDEARAQATVFIAAPFHCAVGRKQGGVNNSIVSGFRSDSTYGSLFTTYSLLSSGSTSWPKSSICSYQSLKRSLRS